MCKHPLLNFQLKKKFKSQWDFNISPKCISPQDYLQEIPLIKGFPTISRPQWGMPWFGKSQQYKQNKQTQPYLIDRYQIKCLLVLAFRALSFRFVS
jgi:hypothetical protein